MFVFSLGMGPVTWLLASEMLPSRARAKGMTLCSFVNRLVSGSVALSALSTCDSFGFAGFFALYGTLGLMGTFWYYEFGPETKGKTLAEITAAFREEDDARSNGCPVDVEQPTTSLEAEERTHNPIRAV
jgi:hypothetical protein